MAKKKTAVRLDRKSSPEDERAFEGLREQLQLVKSAIESNDARAAAAEGYKLGEMVTTFEHIRSPVARRARRMLMILTKARTESVKKRQFDKEEKVRQLEQETVPLIDRGWSNQRIARDLIRRDCSRYSPKSTLRHVNDIAARIRKSR